ncbi:MAG: NUDIX hydrolase [Methylocystis sp.]|nr:NUDIX hydrolase [Methylocystis sp.]
MRLPKGSEARLQYAALPWRVNSEKTEILLVTSRDTRRWVIPKGWPIKGRKPHVVAAIEALQEAGLQGVIAKEKLGDYHYRKRLTPDVSVECRVEVYSLGVRRQRKSWPEKKQRSTHWFPQHIAAELVEEGELRALISAFAPPRATATSR